MMKGTNMLKRFALAVVMVATTGLFTVGTAAPADAYMGCFSRVVMKGDPWSEPLHEEIMRKVGDWVIPTTIPIDGDLSLRSNYCRNKYGMNHYLPKVQFLLLKACWTQNGGFGRTDHQWFDGITYKIQVWDDTGRAFEEEVYVKDNGTSHNCAKVQFPWKVTGSLMDPKWWKLHHRPRWRATAHVHVELFDDKNFDFRTAAGTLVNYVLPSDDRSIGRPHW